jgi:hypothetical protein
VGSLLLAGVLSGCTAARSSLGTSDSSCFLSLPAAANAVRGDGHFIGIHLLTPAQLTRVAPRFTDDLVDAKLTAPHMCVAAYDGFTFTASMVKKPLGQMRGRLAIVVVNASNEKVLVTVIIGRAPLRFGHPHLG